MGATANKLTPLHPTHPGVVLKDEIEYRGISQRKLAAQMGISHTMLNEILNAKRPVNRNLLYSLKPPLALTLKR